MGWHLWVQVSLVFVLVTAVVAGYVAMVGTLQRHHDLMLLVLVLFGGGGGILYAIRDGDLESPRFVLKRAGSEAWYVIRLGWLGDAMYGVAGSVIIFLILPNMSEQAEQGFRTIAPEEETKNSADKDAPPKEEVKNSADKDAPPKAGAGSPKKSSLTESPPPGDRKSALGLLEVMGLALVGGFGGRSAMAVASDRFLRKRVEQVDDRLLAQQADMDALAVVARHLNPSLEDPGLDALQAALGQMSPPVRIRAIDEAIHRSEGGNVERVARPALDVLRILEELDPSLLDNKARAAMGRLQQHLDKSKPPEAR